MRGSQTPSSKSHSLGLRYIRSRLISFKQAARKPPKARGCKASCSSHSCLPLCFSTVTPHWRKISSLCSGATCPNFAGVLAALAACVSLPSAGQGAQRGVSRRVRGASPKSFGFHDCNPRVQTKQLTMTGTAGSLTSSARPRGKGVVLLRSTCCAVVSG